MYTNQLNCHAVIDTQPWDADLELLSGLQEEIFMNGTIVLPHKEIKESQHDPGTIIM